MRIVNPYSTNCFNGKVYQLGKNMNVQKLIDERRKELEGYLAEINRQLEGVPSGSLRLVNRKSRVEYYHYLKGATDDPNRVGHYLRKNQLELISSLAQKDYLNKVKMIVSKQILSLNHLSVDISNDPIEHCYSDLPEGRRTFVTPIVVDKKNYIDSWVHQDYKHGEFDQYAQTFRTEAGERVRSKSEIIIAERLAKYNVPYLYEKPLVLSYYGTIRPDFTILNPRTLKELYWEHMGMMDDEIYVNKNLPRLNAYIKNGIIPGRNLILTFESNKAPLEIQIIDTYIKNWLL